MDPTLPQTNPAGGPNPNTPVGLSVLDLPSFGGTVNGALTGNARAAAEANLRQQIAGTASAPASFPVAPAEPAGLPSFDPSAPSLVTTPANGVMGQGTGLQNALAARGAGDSFEARTAQLQRSNSPGVVGAISNWLLNPVGSPEDQAYRRKDFAGQVYSRPEAGQYFSAHPSLLAHAEADPVGFATKLGPILDAAVAAHNGTATQGTIAHSTPDGMMVKPDENVEHTNATAKAFGTTPQIAHAMTQPHHYTDAEWLHATEGLTNNQLKQMWEMQHYLNPQQQALSTALSIGHAQAVRERAANPGFQGMSPAERAYYDMLKLGGGLSVPMVQQPAGPAQ